MPRRSISTLLRLGSVMALGIMLAACTKGGQFDPTEIFNSDAFDNKTKLKGDREPLFPDGVPGATTGVPPDLVKGYQAPPDQADADTSIQPAPAAAPAAAAAKPKPKSKPKLASAPAQHQDSVWSQKAAPKAANRINVGAKPAASAQSAASDAPWPAPQQPAASQSPWPAPQQPAASQSPWPAPVQTAQPSQSVWPNPPGARTTSQ